MYILLTIWLVGVCFSLWHFSCLLKWSWSARSIMKHTHTQVIIKRRCPRGKFIWKASLWKPIKPITAAKLSKVRRAHESKKKFKHLSKCNAVKRRTVIFFRIQNLLWHWPVFLHSVPVGPDICLKAFLKVVIIIFYTRWCAVVSSGSTECVRFRVSLAPGVRGY